jgi:hypothetical protein
MERLIVSAVNQAKPQPWCDRKQELQLLRKGRKCAFGKWRGDQMDALFKFLGEQPIALGVLLVLIAALFIVVVWAIALATKRGSDISIWGFIRIRGTRIAGLSSNLIIELGSEDIRNHHDFYEDVQKSKRTCSVSVEFKQTFTTTPQIFVALKKIDLGGSLTKGRGGSIDRLWLRTEQASKDGFTLVFETWDDSIVYDASASWIAVGE